jgi:hypothetical protein
MAFGPDSVLEASHVAAILVGETLEDCGPPCLVSGGAVDVSDQRQHALVPAQ